MTAASVGTCCRCGGPCATYKGSVWQWTCSKCIDQHLAAGAARADAKDRKQREKLLAKRYDTTTPVTAGT